MSESPNYRQPIDADREVVERINEFYRKGPHWFAVAMDYFTKPFEWMTGLLPDKAKKAIAKTTKDYVVGPLASAANKTYADKHAFGDFDPPASSVEDVRSRATLVMWEAAERQYAVNAVVTTFQGFGTGLGGPAFIAVDIPAVILANFRLASQVSLCFGYQYDALQVPLLLDCMSLGLEDVEKRFAQKQTLFVALRELQDWLITRSAGEAAEVVIKQALKEGGNVFAKALVQIAEKLGVQLSARQMVKVVPLVGGLGNAGINFWMIGQTHNAALALFAERRLRDDVGDVWVDENIKKPAKADESSKGVRGGDGK